MVLKKPEGDKMGTKELVYSKDIGLKYSLTNKNFQKIIDFYLFRCPVPGKSARGKTFEELGWKGPSQFAALKKELLSSATASLQGNYFPCEKDELKSCFNKVTSVRPTEEYCVFLKHDEKSVMQSLFSAIRNALAHGSFNVKQYNKIRVYYFANHDGYLKAELFLTEDTLLSWIQIIEKNHKESNK